MKKLILAILLPFALAACIQTPKALTGDQVAEVVMSIPLDQRIASVSKKLADNCALMQVALTVAAGFNRDAKVKQAISYGQIAVSKFCIDPPDDVNSAIIMLADVAVQINVAVQEAKI